jgi:hypothetical protein
MQTKYSPFCSLIIEHLFYNEGVSNDLSLIPSGATSELMNRANLKIRAVHGNEFVLYFGEEQTQDGPQAKLVDLLKDGSPKLTFDLRLNNPHFFNFTFLPISEPTQQYYFGNWEVTAQESGLYTASKLPPPPPPQEKKDYVGVGDLQSTAFPDLADLLAALPAPADGEDPPLGAFIDSAEQVFYQWPLLWNAPDKKWMPGTIHPPGGLHGLFRIRIGEKTTKSFIYSGSGIQAPSFGMIELWLGDNGLGQNLLLIEGQPNKLRHLKYRLVFKNRATYWRYHIIAKSANGENGEKTATYEIKSNSGLLFEETTSQLKDQIPEKVVAYKSKGPIPFRQTYPKTEELELLIIEPGNIVNQQVMKLPVPDPQNIKAVKEPAGEGEETQTLWYSDMYIYL